MFIKFNNEKTAAIRHSFDYQPKVYTLTKFKNISQYISIYCPLFPVFSSKGNIIARVFFANLANYQFQAWLKSHVSSLLYELQEYNPPTRVAAETETH